MKNGVYYKNHKNIFLRRIVKGDRINIYAKKIVSTNVNEGRTTTTSTSRERVEYYYQKGANGELIAMPNNKAIKEAVSDCAKAVNMVDKSNAEMRNEIRDNPNYMNEVFDLYNRGCK